MYVLNIQFVLCIVKIFGLIEIAIIKKFHAMPIFVRERNFDKILSAQLSYFILSLLTRLDNNFWWNFIWQAFVVFSNYLYCCHLDNIKTSITSRIRICSNVEWPTLARSSRITVRVCLEVNVYIVELISFIISRALLYGTIFKNYLEFFYFLLSDNLLIILK